MTIKLTKNDLKSSLEGKLIRLAQEVEDIGNAHFVAIEMLKDSIYESNEEKEEYYKAMSDELYNRLKSKRAQIERTAYVYKCMFGTPM